ncbi:hypothetical protein NA57DRAFT_75726 [Rhizodiscina lignyota]|uniref:Uncharacterized protein n=1 Tax=Rhizodiscina lignyota TaxID=1504668 RepID=A0A9P4IAV5_9PEZI|nr:hypothetical protein NA57DRAFT_75726 [Rhizodiscina lignyota]
MSIAAFEEDAWSELVETVIHEAQLERNKPKLQHDPELEFTDKSYSKFLQLPAEIRYSVYESYLGSDNLLTCPDFMGWKPPVPVIVNPRAIFEPIQARLGDVARSHQDSPSEHALKRKREWRLPLVCKAIASDVTRHLHPSFDKMGITIEGTGVSIDGRHYRTQGVVYPEVLQRLLSRYFEHAREVLIHSTILPCEDLWHRWDDYSGLDGITPYSRELGFGYSGYELNSISYAFEPWSIKNTWRVIAPLLDRNNAPHLRKLTIVFHTHVSMRVQQSLLSQSHRVLGTTPISADTITWILEPLTSIRTAASIVLESVHMSTDGGWGELDPVSVGIHMRTKLSQEVRDSFPTLTKQLCKSTKSFSTPPHCRAFDTFAYFEALLWEAMTVPSLLDTAFWLYQGQLLRDEHDVYSYRALEDIVLQEYAVEIDSPSVVRAVPQYIVALFKAFRSACKEREECSGTHTEGYWQKRPMYEWLSTKHPIGRYNVHS